MTETPNPPPVDDLDDDMSIDERAALWALCLPRRNGLKFVQMPRDQVKAFLAAATINAGTSEAAQKLQARISFAASVINVPAKPMIELVEAFITTTKPAQPANADSSGPPKPKEPAKWSPKGIQPSPTAPIAPDQAIATPVESKVAQPADASEAPKTT
jgi:hypothetical protein